MQITGFTVLGDGTTEYRIEVRNGTVACSCPAYTYGGGVPCKHMHFVASKLAQPVSA